MNADSAKKTVVKNLSQHGIEEQELIKITEHFFNLHQTIFTIKCNPAL